MVLAGAVALAAFGGGAAGLGLPDWLAGVIGAVTALVAATIVDRVYEARNDQSAAFEGRRRVLDPLSSGTSAASSAANAVPANRNDALGLLRADRSPMPFRGRTRELRELAQ